MSRWKKKNKEVTGDALYMREWSKTKAGQAYRKKHAEYAREWRKKNKEKFHATQKRCYEKVRGEMLVHYSQNPPSCECCGETRLYFLSLDHIKGNGSEHRRQIVKENGGTPIGGNALPYWLKKHGWPKGFQVLCYNCNFAKRNDTSCPCQKDKTKTIQC